MSQISLVYQGAADTVAMKEISALTEHILTVGNVPQEVRMKFLIAVDEVFSNICRYSQATEAKVVCTIKNNLIRLCFEDNGIPFNPLSHKKPDIAAKAENRKAGGLGIFLITQQMDQLNYKRSNGKNQLMIIKFQA